MGDLTDEDIAWLKTLPPMHMCPVTKTLQPLIYKGVEDRGKLLSFLHVCQEWNWEGSKTVLSRSSAEVRDDKQSVQAVLDYCGPDQLKFVSARLLQIPERNAALRKERITALCMLRAKLALGADLFKAIIEAAGLWEDPLRF